MTVHMLYALSRPSTCVHRPFPLSVRQHSRPVVPTLPEPHATRTQLHMARTYEPRQRALYQFILPSASVSLSLFNLLHRDRLEIARKPQRKAHALAPSVPSVQSMGTLPLLWCLDHR